MHNVPESESTDLNTRKKKDTDFVQSVFSNVLNSPATITNAIRFGKKDSHTRLLKKTVQSLDEKKLSFVTNSSSEGRKTQILYVNFS